jgi:PAS domain S-box-containing protein
VRIYPLPPCGAASLFERINAHDTPTATLASQLTAAEMIYAAADAIVSVDAEGILRTFNPAAEELTGLSAVDALGRNFAELELFTPASLETARAELAQVLAGQVRPPIELELRNRSGQLLTVEANARRALRADAALCAHVVLRDATGRKRLEADLVAEQRLLKQLLSAHELERKLLAYEIHDGLVQHVTGALMHLEAGASLEPPTRPAARSELEISLKLLRETIAEGRRLISGLRPPILDEQGVVAAIEYLVDECREESATEIEFSARVQFDRLHPILESSLFRIVQEALHNARRYSGSPRIRIELRQVGLRLHVEVRDWGVGFDPAEVRETRYGLQGIRERARLLQGGATIDSEPNKGTLVCVDVPMWKGGPPPGTAG